MSYFAEWVAAGVVTTLALVIMPWLALAVLLAVLLVMLAAVAALVGAAVAMPYVLARALHRRRRTRRAVREPQVLHRPLAAYTERN